MFTYMLAPWIRHGIGKNCGGGPGVVRLQVWPGVSQLDLGAADLRIFSSPDARGSPPLGRGRRCHGHRQTGRSGRTGWAGD